MQSTYLTAQELSDILNVTKQAVMSRAKRGLWPYSERACRGGQQRVFKLADLPESIQQKITIHSVKMAGVEIPTPHTSSNSYCKESLWANFDRKSENQKQKAKERLGLLNAVQQLIDGGMGSTYAFQYVASTSDVSWQTLRDQYHGSRGKKGVKHYDRSDWWAVLVPQHVGRQKRAYIPPEAWEYFKADYLRLEKPSATVCYERLKVIANDRGWNLPSLKTFERRIAKEIPKTTKVLMREGESALYKMFPPQERSVRDMYAMEHINGDGYMHNVFVMWPGIEKPVRVKTWFWQDVYSRKIIAYRTDLSENADIIRLSFGDVVEKYGIPEHITVDNTRAAANKWMTGRMPNRYRFKVKEDDPTGIWLTMGIQPHWTSVINGQGWGQAKPIERAFGVGGLEEYVDKHPEFVGAYTGANPTAKPENYASKAIPLKRFLEILQQGVAMFNAKLKRNTEICAGIHSFDQAFEQSYKTALVRKGTAEQRRLWLLASESIKVSRHGTVTLESGADFGVGKNRYGAEFMYEHIGKKVIVRFDPQNLHEEVYIYSLDNRFLGKAECIDKSGFRDNEAGRIQSKLRTRFVKAQKQMAETQTQLDALQASKMLPDAPEPATPESKVIRPVFANTQKVVGSDLSVDAPADEDMEAVTDFVLRLAENNKDE